VGYSYSTFVTALAAEIAVDPTNSDFLAILPTLIDDAEQTCYRELDLLVSVVTVTGSATANNRTFAIPQTSGHILVVDQVNVIDNSGIRHQVTPATREGVEFLFPSNTAPSTPSYPTIFARIDDTNIMWGPSTDAAYTVETIGTIRPAALSSTNTSTFLSNYVSDLFFAAAMVSASAYMRNFGAMADDPKMAISWKSEYAARLASAKKEELRKSYVVAMSAPPASQKDA
jgi:hypothetical protein